jgi:hypothetical protein
MPDDLIQATVGAPATSLSEYEDQLMVLQDKLQESEACMHYRNFAIKRLSMRCDHDLLNDIEAAQFMQMTPRDYEQLFTGDIVVPSTPDPS